MANPLEVGRVVLNTLGEKTEGIRKSYPVNLVGRAAGIPVYQEVWRTFNPQDQADREYSTVVECYASIVALGAPLIARAIFLSKDSEFKAMTKVLAGAAVDVTLTGFLLTNSHSVPEFLAYKAAANIGSHAMVDALKYGLNRIRNLRPPTAVTLAI